MQNSKVRSLPWHFLQDLCRKSKAFTPAFDFRVLSICAAPFRNQKSLPIFIFVPVFYTYLFPKCLIFPLMWYYAWHNANIIYHLKCILYHTCSHHLHLKLFCAMSGFGQCKVYLLFHTFTIYIPQRLGDLLSKVPLGAVFKIQTNERFTDSGTHQTFTRSFHCSLLIWWWMYLRTEL